jgi:hypothetical protein
MRREGEAVITEELIRVKTRDRRIAEIARRGGDTVTRTTIRRKPLLPALATVLERSAGSGTTAAARGEKTKHEPA